MSIYYECRFNNVVLDLSARPDIVTWLENCRTVYMGKRIETIPPSELRIGSRCDPLFYNSFTYDIPLYLNITDTSNVVIDYTLGNKNKNNDIEEIILLFSKYYKSGKIILYNEDDYFSYDMEKIRDESPHPGDMYTYGAYVDEYDFFNKG